MNRHIIFLLAAAFLIIAQSQSVLSLGISPGRVVVNFEPHLEKTFTITILNNEHKSFKAAVFVRGDLAPYVAVKDSSVEFTADEESKSTLYTVKLPASFDSPGLHSSDIVVREISSSGAAEGISIGYLVSVVSQLYVQVPYPGKYAEINLDVLAGKAGEDVTFYIPVLNRGEEDFTARATVSVFEGDKEIGRVTSNEKQVSPKGRQELQATWKSSAPGIFRAVATVEYGADEPATVEKEFLISEDFLLNLLDIAVENFKLGDIATFNVLVENLGGRKIIGASSRLSLFDEEQKQVADARSSASDIEPNERTAMNSYWDTADVHEGSYEGNISLSYEDQSSESAIRTTVTKDSIRTEILGITAHATATVQEKERSNVSLLWGIILVLIAANIIWFVYFRRRKNNAKK